MIFADIPAGADVFIDANVLLYSLTHYPLLSPPSKALLDRMSGATSPGTRPPTCFPRSPIGSWHWKR
jgi:hypothetical protein